MNSQSCILLVDDEVQILASLSRLLKLNGFSVLTADSAAAAMEIIVKNSVDLVISDYRMPDITGLELMVRIKNTHPSIIRILLTAFSEKEVLEQAINQGEIYRFFNKPWDEDELLASVTEAMAYKQNLLKEKQQVAGDLRQSNIETVMAIAEAVELKDPYTKGHCSRVRDFAIQIAEAAGLALEWHSHLIYGALLHDCGKIGIEEALLVKPGKLSEGQRKIVERHSVLGFELMNSVSHLKTASLFVRQHHERWDGKGYPDGLRRDQIHICARIISIADAYDAMTSDRPYRKGMAAAKAREVLRACRGSQFDPELVDLFVSVLSADNAFDEAHPGHIPGNRKKPVLLFVDQDTRFLDAMTRLFDHDSYVVETSRDAKGAMDVLGRNPVDILVSDHDLAGISGLELLSQVKSRFPGVIRMLLSDHSEPEKMAAAINEADIFKVIMTPFQETEFKSTIKNAIERKQMAHVVGGAGF